MDKGLMTKDFPDKTIILITHKIENLKGMDKIYKVQDHTVRECSYAELEESVIVHPKEKE